jgi:hypothetical protein
VFPVTCEINSDNFSQTDGPVVLCNEDAALFFAVGNKDFNIT